MRLINKIIRAYLTRYGRELNYVKNNSLDLQRRQLQKVLRSPFSARRSIKKEDDFRRLPISSYDDYSEEVSMRLNSNSKPTIYDDVKYFARTAGTTRHESKYIPTSAEYFKKNHAQASWLTLSILYSLRKDMDLFGNKTLLMGGAIYSDTPDKIIADVSGIMIKKIPRIFHRYHVPSIEDTLNSNWQEKFKTTAVKAAAETDVVMIGGVPTWIITLCKEVLILSGKENILEVWPNLKVFLHGGVNFAPYRLLFSELIPKEDFTYLEVYNASEGFFAVQDTVVNNGLLLMTNAGIYYEFISQSNFQKENYKIHDLNNIEINVPYVLLISNISGLYRYLLGDVIAFCSTEPYRIKVVGRIEEYINAFGENLNLSVVHEALAVVLKEHKSSIREFFVAPKYLSLQNTGCHQWFVEFEKEPIDLEKFSSDLDQRIQDKNFEYRQKRLSDLALRNLEIISLKSGFFDYFMRKKGRIGGQNKIQKLNNNRKLADEVMSELTKVRRETIP